MSQWGAQGQALQGRGYRAIVGSYFPGTKVASAASQTTLRVRLTAAPSAAFSGASKAGTRTLNPRTTYRARLFGARVELRGGGRTVTIPTSATISGRGPLAVAGLGRYRGALELSAAADANDVNGQPPGRQPRGRRGLPARRRHAGGVRLVEAGGAGGAGGRLAHLRGHGRSRPGRLATTSSPTRARRSTAASRGESATGDRAVRATRGQVVTYRGRAVPVFFHASSGGRTDSAEEGFDMTPQPWLVSVADPADATPANKSHRWTRRIALATAERLLRRAGWLRGSLEAIEPRGRKSSGRIVTADGRRAAAATSS